MLGGLFLAAKAQNLFIDVTITRQGYLTGGKVTFTGSGFGPVRVDMNASQSTFNLSPSGGFAPRPLPYFAIHEIYGVASGGGGGGSHGFYFNEYGEGGSAGKSYSVLVKLFSPEMTQQWAIHNVGGTAGVSGTTPETSTNGGNGRTTFTPVFLFSTKTWGGVGIGGRKWPGTGTQYNDTGEQSSSPPYGNGGNGGIRNSAAAQAGNEGSVLCRGMVW